MRIRYELYKNGEPCGWQAECDMSKEKAEERYNELYMMVRCGWAEMIAEDEEEGGNMDIVKSFDHINLAKSLTKIFG